VDGTRTSTESVEGQIRTWEAELVRLRSEMARRVADARAQYIGRVAELRRLIETRLGTAGVDPERLLDGRDPAERTVTLGLLALRDLYARIEAELRRWAPSSGQISVWAATVETHKAIGELKEHRRRLQEIVGELRGFQKSAHAAMIGTRQSATPLPSPSPPPTPGASPSGSVSFER
jgi:hypothetical protein